MKNNQPEQILKQAKVEALKLISDAKIAAAGLIRNAKSDKDLLTGEKKLLEYVSKKRFIDTERIPRICDDIRDIRNILSEMPRELSKSFVSKDAFQPVKTIAYGLVAAVMTGVIGGLLLLLFKK